MAFEHPLSLLPWPGERATDMVVKTRGVRMPCPKTPGIVVPVLAVPARPCTALHAAALQDPGVKFRLESVLELLSAVIFPVAAGAGFFWF